MRLGLVGFGKIAQAEHVGAITVGSDFELVAIASPGAQVPGLRCHERIEDMLAGEAELDAVVMCQPPQLRFDAARAALLAGKHVFLEKPPGATVTEVEALASLARQRDLTLLAGWHSRFALGVAPAKDWLKNRQIERIDIRWRENVRKWHPGQGWIWEPGGFGVFDPGINALSILTAIVPEPIRLLDAELDKPANLAAPIAARLTLVTLSGGIVRAEFDWRETGAEIWDIDIATSDGRGKLCAEGARFSQDRAATGNGQGQEYPAMYRHFAALIRRGQSDVDLTPLRLAADAFLRGKQRTIEDFCF